MLLLYLVEEEDPIGFSWLLYWYLPCVTDIVVGGFSCCPILYLGIDFSFYRCTGGEVELMAGETIFVHQVGDIVRPIVIWR